MLLVRLLLVNSRLWAYSFGGIESYMGIFNRARDQKYFPLTLFPNPYCITSTSDGRSWNDTNIEKRGFWRNTLQLAKYLYHQVRQLGTKPLWRKDPSHHIASKVTPDNNLPYLRMKRRNAEPEKHRRRGHCWEDTGGSPSARQPKPGRRRNPTLTFWSL